MKIESLKEVVDQNNKGLIKIHKQMQGFIEALNKREVSKDVSDALNAAVAEINGYQGDTKGLKKLIRKEYILGLRLVKKTHNWVNKAYYLTLWMSLGMATFGIPIGIALSAAIGNAGLIGTGIPIGMGIGLAIGAGLDKKAKEEGRQLDF